MKEISGEVDYKDEGEILAPGIIRPAHRTIPILRLRILTPNGNLVQVLYKGDYPGDATIGHEVIVKGIEKGGVIHAKSIFNKTTNSWVTKKPGCLDCFIATAVYGSSFAQEVIMLKIFRDNFLLKNNIGRKFIYFYYFISPSIAATIKTNKYLKFLIKIFFLKPCLNLIKLIKDNKVKGTFK